MAYPREIFLDSDTESRLKSYLEEELSRHYGERGRYIDDLLRWQASYWAEPSNEEVLFPFRGASNIVIPLNAIAVEAIHARTMTTLFGIPQLVSAKATAPEWDVAARPFERYMDHVLLHDLKIKNKMSDAVLEIEKFGTGLGKAGYENVVKYAMRDLGDGIEESVPVTIRKGACLDTVPSSRFIMPFSSQDPQTAPWCGEEHSETPYQVRMMEQSGLFREGTFAALEQYIGTLQQSGTNEFEGQQAELENRAVVWPDRINWVELWLAFNVDGNADDIQHEIVVHWHRESGIFLSIRYNWYTDLRRPYRKGNYIPLEHRWNGIGICKQNDMFQEEITAMHRSQLDNANLANMRMIKVSRMSGYGPDEPLFPGKIWNLDDMTHVDSIQMAEIYPSSYNSEQSTLLFSQQRTGVNEVTLGMPQVGTPGTATSDLSRLQEGNKKFGYVLNNIKEFVDELVIDVACNIQQFGPRTVEYLETMENGGLVKSFFDLPEKFIREGMILELRTSREQENKLVDRQNLVQIAQLYQQFGATRIQIAQMLMQLTQDPTIFVQTLNAVFKGSAELMSQILETFDLRNVERLIQGANPNAGQIGAAGNQGLIGAGPTQALGAPSQVYPPMSGGVS